MRAGRVIEGMLAVAAAALLSAPAAFAASSQDIRKDLADGRLDGTYTKAELERFVKSATFQGYGHPIQRAGAERGARRLQGARPLAAVKRSPSLPFTGLDLALLTGGGVFLLSVGAGLRKLGRDA